MNKYFTILNWTLLFVLLLVAFRISPAIGTHALTWGALLGNMMTGGLISWKYNHLDTEAQKLFAERYFQKDYGIEILAKIFVVCVMALFAIFLWHGLYFFVGIFLMWCVNILVEAFYAYCQSHK